MKDKLTLYSERARKKYEKKKQKADPLVQAIKRNDENLRKAWLQFYLR
jgi:hypothetical protein